MKIGIIGCGNMGKALAKALSVENDLLLYDHHLENTNLLVEAGYGKACETSDAIFSQVEMIILAIKPQNLEEFAEELKGQLNNDQVLVSILAGKTISSLRKYFPRGKIIRMMPNLMITVGMGLIGLCSEEIREMPVFNPLGKIFWIPEEKINAFTAISGSGPAFFFEIFGAMNAAGLMLGFTQEQAQEFVFQMLKGSLALLEYTGYSYNELKRQIASPQGTTIEGLKILQKAKIQEILVNTFQAAYERANRLSEELGAFPLSDR